MKPCYSGIILVPLPYRPPAALAAALALWPDAADLAAVSLLPRLGRVCAAALAAPWRSRTAHPAGVASAPRLAGPLGWRSACLWRCRVAGDAAQPGGRTRAAWCLERSRTGCHGGDGGGQVPRPLSARLGAVAGGLWWRPAGNHAAHSASSPGASRSCSLAAVWRRHRYSYQCRHDLVDVLCRRRLLA